MVQALFSDLVGQDTAIALLARAVRQRRVAPAYLFAGPNGVGRRLAAERLAEVLFAADPTTLTGPDPTPNQRRRITQRNHPDLLWVEPTYLHQGNLVPASAAAEQGITRKSAPQIRLEQVRQIAQFLSRPPLESPRCVVVLEAAETMAEGAANGLLKTLEEPGQATIVLLAPGPQALLPTLVSRCQTIPFQRLNSPDLTTVLQRAGQAEVLNQPQVIAMAQGSPGQAIVAYQQLQAIPTDLLQALHQPPKTLRAALDQGRQVAKALDTESQLWLLDYLLNWYWQQYPVESAQWLPHLEKAKGYLRRFVQPRLVWEVMFMELATLTR
ncbi:DNA polymerase III subunit delta' [Phormidium sp. FACHB-1136]|uniref:DNA polymerase III subunit delta' n=1 Tax=Phormidium sp. FACHB-1136 TaxID=2692848 RepID=UPI001689C147|nr:DNA polymerase III subunit delta' [Phormidium sp. FACHB-1136]MBD2425845.1 DNA polymerase III subunit delta' [Phormidium sp. FACHB-1136]